MAKCGHRSNRRHKNPRIRPVARPSRLYRSSFAGFLPRFSRRVHAKLRPMQRPTLAVPRLSLRAALLICAGDHRRRGLGAFLDGPHAHLPVRLQALAWRSRRCGGVAAPDRLVHLQPRPARLHFLLAAVGRLARPSVGGGPAADRRPHRGGLGVPRELPLHDRALSRAHDLARLRRRQHRQLGRRHAGDGGGLPAGGAAAGLGDRGSG